MQGIVTDESGAYVKAAIVKLIREKDPEGEPEETEITYVKTDEEGNFTVQSVDPEAKYVIEIQVEKQETDIAPASKKAGRPKPLKIRKKQEKAEEELEQGLKEKLKQELKEELKQELEEGVEKELEGKSEIRAEDPYERIGAGDQAEDFLDLDDPDDPDYDGDAAEFNFIKDDFAVNGLIENDNIWETMRENIFTNSLNNADLKRKGKSYMTRNNLW